LQGMKHAFNTRVLVIALVLLGLAPQANPCSWAIGYFHQVTQLRGGVVGAKLGILQNIGWLRQLFARKHAKLSLYSYSGPNERWSERPLVKTTETNNDGNFDFGALDNRHYNLVIEDTDWGSSDSFDVEVKHMEQRTESVVIDVSPFTPDCKGGHEFIVKTK
jgi:hypothetical protein